MAYTTEQVDTLEAAIAQGAKRVQYADKTVEYRSLSEMIELLGIMKTELGLIPAKTRKLAQHSKGL